MKGFLTPNQIEYVLYHFELSFKLNKDIREKFIFCKSSCKTIDYADKVIFLMSENEFDISKVKKINSLPVLFPIDNHEKEWDITDNNLIFFHDYLKSCFYLLSGYHEYKSNKKDSLGRYDYYQSVQHELNITNIPLVNYYFEIIISGLQAFLQKDNQSIIKKKLFNPFGFFLTHDVDRVRLYNINNFLYCSKSLLGFAKEKMPFRYRLYSFIDAFAGFFKRTDPFWTFPFMREVERKNGFKSAFYFLDHLPDHKNYDFTSDKIRKLIASLEKEGCEIGMHSTVEATLSLNESIIMKNKLQKVVKTKIVGNRNHILLFHIPMSMIILKKSGYQYDSTLGYANHEGFRNSFCYPFKLFDFENDEMIDDIWEIPLTVMDCTLFDYRKLSYNQAFHSVISLINEIKKFGGIFTLLWHNSYFEERRYPGITNFYNQVLEELRRIDAVNITGREIISMLP